MKRNIYIIRNIILFTIKYYKNIIKIIDEIWIIYKKGKKVEIYSDKVKKGNLNEK